MPDGRDGAGAEPTASLKKGTPDLKSAGPLAFGPDGILFVGDTKGAALFAIDTGDERGCGREARRRGQGPGRQGRGLLGTDSKQIMINDLAVNPAVGKRLPVGLARTRARRDPAASFGSTRTASSKSCPLENVRFAKADLPNAPGADSTAAGRVDHRPGLRRRPRLRRRTVERRVLVAADRHSVSRSAARAFDGAAIEIYHGAHGRFETKSPIRTFVTYRIKNEPYMLAAYTCTPLVKMPVAELKAGAHIKGTTIAELGNRNRPLDMIVYQKDGKDYLLMTNSSRGVMKIPTEGAGTAEGITAPRAGQEGARLRDDRQPQGRRADGPARRPSRRAARARRSRTAR